MVYFENSGVYSPSLLKCKIEAQNGLYQRPIFICNIFAHWHLVLDIEAHTHTPAPNFHEQWRLPCNESPFLHRGLSRYYQAAAFETTPASSRSELSACPPPPKLNRRRQLRNGNLCARRKWSCALVTWGPTTKVCSCEKGLCACACVCVFKTLLFFVIPFSGKQFDGFCSDVVAGLQIQRHELDHSSENLF